MGGPGGVILPAGNELLASCDLHLQLSKEASIIQCLFA